ncbi:MAG: MATE family efflux transporter [Dysgonomonas sp.]
MSGGVQNLTEGKILSGLLKLALPLMGTSFVQMAYNLMAMMWVGRLGVRSEAAIGAIGMLLWMTSSIAILTMVGVEVSVGQSIGAKKMERARIFASHSTTVAIVIGLIWAMVLFVGGYTILSFFKLPADITHEASVYLKILTICLPFQFVSYNFAGIYNGAGRSSVPFKINTFGLVLNMILDPILMFLLDLGFYGAAVGTVISQLLVFTAFTYRLKSKQSILGRFSFFIKPKSIYLKRIFFLGTPVSIMNSLYSFININLARVTSIYGGHIGLLTQTTGGQIEGVTWTTSQGFSTALSAYMAQNFAANKPERGKKAYLYALKIMLVWGSIISLLFIFLGSQIFGLIIPDEAAMDSGAQYLFIVGLVQIFMMLELTTQGMFNGIGRTIEPAVISITFNALRIPLAYFLASQYGVVGVWWAIAISTVCKGTILPLWFLWVYNKETRKKAKS